MPALEWIGKNKVIKHHLDVEMKTFNKIYTFNSDVSNNMIIHGDNLVALKSLLPKYERRIDCVYIDPPYNTGNEHWIYNDNLNDPYINNWLGKVVGEEGEDLNRHDKWLCMMYPRLVLLKKLLSETGVLFISIDEHEMQNLISICNELFGIKNVEVLVWMKNDSKVDRNTNAKIIKRTKSVHEYIVCCYMNKGKTVFNKIKKKPSWSHSATNPDKDPRGPWQSGIISFEEGHAKEDKNSEYYYTITTPSGKQYTRMWFVLREEWDRLVADNRISFPKKGEGVPRLKTFENEEKEYYLETIITGLGTSSSAKDELLSIFGQRDIFDTPKPSKLIKELIRASTNKNSIVLDCFAGSGTLAQSVLELNSEDSGNRTFIEIELMDYADTLTSLRAKKTINGEIEGKEKVEGNFTFYELGEPIFNEFGNFNDNLEISDIKDYLMYAECKLGASDLTNSPFIGSKDNIGYYIFSELNGYKIFNNIALKDIKNKFSSYVIYGDSCTIAEDYLTKNNIIFKKIPTDLRKF